MDPNRIPDRISSVHLIAACGTGMGALACMLKEMGFVVTGSDANVYPPMSTYLAARGIEISTGFSGGNLAHGPDLVVVGNAVRKDNPEVLAMQEMKLPFCSMPQALNRFVVKDRKILLVSGTHGKTTTASMLAWILQAAGYDPSFMIGGILANFDANYRLGKGDYVVIEGDEYDTAFFDKRPKFMHYDPFITLLTSVEFDHADIFTDLDHVKSAFTGFLGNISSEHTLIAWDEDVNIDAVLQNGRGPRVERYGRLSGSEWRIFEEAVDPPWNCFTATGSGAGNMAVRMRVPGRHNRLNALAASAAAIRVGISPETVAEAMAGFAGVKRRQEIRGVKRGVTVIDDFAHHPTAVYETICAIRPFYPDGRLIAVFEPRTNTSMRRVFQDVYPAAFDPADLICIRKPPLLSKIPEGERFSSEQLVSDICRRGKDARYFEDTAQIIDFVAGFVKSGDVILVMSNGGFDNIHERLLERL